MNKIIARQMVYQFARTLYNQGCSQDDFEYYCDLVPEASDIREAIDLVPEVLPHVATFVWTFRR
jgi:hypothetical protein